MQESGSSRTTSTSASTRTEQTKMERKLSSAGSEQKPRRLRSEELRMMFMPREEFLYDQIEKARLQTNQDGVTHSGAKKAFSFIKQFEAELTRLTASLASHLESQELSAKAALTNMDTTVNTNEDPKSEKLRAEAQAFINSSLSLEKLTQSTMEVLTKIASYADQALMTRCVLQLQECFDTEPCWKGSNSALVVILSDMYQVIRAVESKQDRAGDEKWQAPASFERTTTKFWVKEDRLSEVLLTAVQHVPLLVYGRSGRLTTSQHAEGDKLWNSLATPISSVYFDSPKLCLYKERIARVEGAQLFRVRWYGEKRPHGTDLVFLELKTHHEKWINSKSVKERVNIQEKDMYKFLERVEWTTEDAEAVVRAATPTLKGQDLETATKLLLTMHQLVLKQDLHPCVRSIYNRVAFQSSSSNDLRLTVDRNVTLVDESSAVNGDSWCLPDDAITNNMQVTVPYIVFEVKVAGSDMPPEIQSLVDSGTIKEAPKFSKFLTGAAAHHASEVEALPYWADHPAFAEMLLPPKSEEVTANTDLSGPRKRRSIRFSKISSVSDVTDVGISIDDEEDQVMRKASLKTRRPSLLSSWSLQSSPRIMPQKAARVEPKSYFANERTFIQWISAALLLITISAILVETGGSTNYTLSNTSKALSIGAAVVVVYATFVYFRRISLLSKGRPYGYVDWFGPLLLGTAVFVGVLVLLVNLFSSSDDTVSPVLYAETGSCYLHSNDNIWALMYEPSDVAIDANRGLLLVVSLQQIVAHSITNQSAEAQTLIEIPNTDLEGLTYAGENLFALSEGLGTGALIELEWANDTLQVVKQWPMENSVQAEGIAYGSDSKGPALFITQDKRIDVYNVPNFSSWDLERRGAINSHVLHGGLTQGKISSLYFFEGLLYVLYDNDQKVRGWDMKTAALQVEFNLPMVGGGNDKQWEGLAIERNTGESSFATGTSSLRGATEADLIVHLALDSPPQVWSFGVREDKAAGRLLFPDCAAVPE